MEMHDFLEFVGFAIHCVEGSRRRPVRGEDKKPLRG